MSIQSIIVKTGFKSKVCEEMILYLTSNVYAYFVHFVRVYYQYQINLNDAR